LPFDPHELARIRFLNQFQILDELSCRIESALADIEKHSFRLEHIRKISYIDGGF
jgi:hypothetical protein